MEEIIKYKLILDKDYTIVELQIDIEKGARFIVFQYCISVFFAVTLRRFSPAILIKEPIQAEKHKRKFNILSWLFGFWGLPWGPIYSIRSFMINKKGGIDVTEDIMMNINQESIEKREIQWQSTQQLFCLPNKDDIKAFKKSFQNEIEIDYNIRKLVAGWYINTEEYEEPYYVIGIRMNKPNDLWIENLKKSLKKQFRRNTRFEFINEADQNETFQLLLKQGFVLIDRK